MTGVTRDVRAAPSGRCTPRRDGESFPVRTVLSDAVLTDDHGAHPATADPHYGYGTTCTLERTSRRWVRPAEPRLRIRSAPPTGRWTVPRTRRPRGIHPRNSPVSGRRGPVAASVGSRLRDRPGHRPARETTERPSGASLAPAEFGVEATDWGAESDGRPPASSKCGRKSVGVRPGGRSSPLEDNRLDTMGSSEPAGQYGSTRDRGRVGTGRKGSCDDPRSTSPRRWVSHCRPRRRCDARRVPAAS
jgi:hypothetical protein